MVSLCSELNVNLFLFSVSTFGLRGNLKIVFFFLIEEEEEKLVCYAFLFCSLANINYNISKVSTIKTLLRKISSFTYLPTNIDMII